MYKLFVALVLPLLVAQGCGNNKAQAPKEDNDPHVEDFNSHLDHFWDNVDPAALGADDVEQRLVDYIYLTVNATPERRRLCWQTIARTFPDEQPNRLVADYLGEPGSPLYAPAMLEEYLAAIADLYAPDDLERARIDYLLGGIRKNKPGQVIADLDLISAPDGRLTTLHTLISGHHALILFYDPSCADCSALISRLASRAQSAQRSATLRVVPEERDSPSRATVAVEGSAKGARHSESCQEKEQKKERDTPSRASDSIENPTTESRSSDASDQEVIVAISVTGEAKELPQGWHSCIAADAAQLDDRFFLPRLPQLYHTTPTLRLSQYPRQ